VNAANAPCTQTWPGPSAFAASSSKVTATTLATTAPTTIASTVAALSACARATRFMCPASARRRTTRTQSRYDQVATFQPIRARESRVRTSGQKTPATPPSTAQIRRRWCGWSAAARAFLSAGAARRVTRQG
jgi:hypothetical protein